MNQDTKPTIEDRYKKMMADADFWPRKNLQIKSLEMAIQILGPTPYDPKFPVTSDDVYDLYLSHYFTLSETIFDLILET